MAQSQVALYNMALAAIGHDYTVETVSEKSIAAETCELWYENVRQTILRAAHWNSAKREARLTLVAEKNNSTDWVPGDPEPGWPYSFEVPAGMLAARYLSTFQEFSLGYDTGASKRIISTNVDEPILVYTVDVTDLTLLEPDLYQALIYGLASHIVMPLTGKLEKAEAMVNIANAIILNARAATANERQRLIEVMPRDLQARGYHFSVANPFIYPYGALLTATGAPTT